jgi:hypothetical protein
VLASLALAAGALTFYVHEEIVDERVFSARATAALDEPVVRQVVAEQIVEALVDQGSIDLLAVRPLLQSAVEALVGTEPFRRLLAFGLSDAHATLVGKRDVSVILDLERAGGFIIDALRSVSPQIAEAVPEDVSPRLAELSDADLEADSARTLARVSDAGLPLLIIGLLTAGGSVAVAELRRKAISRLGAGLLAGGGALLVMLAIASELVAAEAARSVGGEREDAVREAVMSVWSSLFGDLSQAALVAAALGASLAAVASGVLRPTQAQSVWRGILIAVRSPRPAVRAAEGVAWLVVGTLLLLEPLLMLRLLAIGGGMLAIFVGVSEITGALERRPPRVRGREMSAQFAVAGLSVALVGVAAAVLAAMISRPGEGLATIIPREGCNGSRALCAKRLNEVVFPATHNSFSAANRPGWLFANQRYDVQRQLGDGIRAFLLDVHYGVLDRSRGRVRTDLEAEGSDRNRVARELDPEALEVAERLVGRIGLGQLAGERLPYLCHTLCELGAEPFEAQLRVIRDFLAGQPNEVLMIVFEPYVAPEVVERSLQTAGLMPYLAALERGKPLPTLGELVESGRRLVVFTEHDAGAYPWYLPAFEFFQDTPLGARRPAELSCSPSRGTPDSPLLMLNHWIDSFPPPPSRNAQIGGRFLRERIERCARARGMLPNLVAVDYYDRSGVVSAAASANAARP